MYFPRLKLALALATALSFTLPQPALADALAGLNAEEREIVTMLQVHGANAQNIDSALKFWRQAPEYLKNRVRAAPVEMRWPIILCNFLGFKVGETGRTSADACEASLAADIERGKHAWSMDGQYVGPSEACKARNKRNGYGQLICD